MEHTITKTIPEHTEEVYDKTTCDSCGKDLECESCDEFDTVTIEWERGTRGHGEADTYTDDVDLCGKCFETRLKPFLISEMGCKIVTKNKW